MNYSTISIRDNQMIYRDIYVCEKVNSFTVKTPSYPNQLSPYPNPNPKQTNKQTNEKKTKEIDHSKPNKRESTRTIVNSHGYHQLLLPLRYRLLHSSDYSSHLDY